MASSQHMRRHGDPKPARYIYMQAPCRINAGVYSVPCMACAAVPCMASAGAVLAKIPSTQRLPAEPSYSHAPELVPVARVLSEPARYIYMQAPCRNYADGMPTSSVPVPCQLHAGSVLALRILGKFWQHSTRHPLYRHHACTVHAAVHVPMQTALQAPCRAPCRRGIMGSAHFIEWSPPSQFRRHAKR